MIRSTAFKGGSILKTGIFGNCVFATFSKNIKQLTYAECNSEIPPNSYRFRMNRKYCYQIFEGAPDKGVEKYFARIGLWMVSDCEELVGVTHRR